MSIQHKRTFFNYLLVLPFLQGLKKNETIHFTLFYLTNSPSFLNFPCFYYSWHFLIMFDVFSYAGLRLAPLSAAHAHLVNSTWKYGGDRNSYNSVLNYITHNPSLCVIEEGGTEPVSWLLVYQHAALGLLYTFPQHRRKGYAKLLVSVMAKNLLEQGHPVYCLWKRKMTLPTNFSLTWVPEFTRLQGCVVWAE